MILFNYFLEKINKHYINLNDFSEIYSENQDSSLEFTDISDSKQSSQSTTLNAMINAIKSFDHQGTGFISINELKFSKRKGEEISLI